MLLAGGTGVIKKQSARFCCCWYVHGLQVTSMTPDFNPAVFRAFHTVTRGTVQSVPGPRGQVSFLRPLEAQAKHKK